MEIMALCPTVRLLFPLGMAMRHRASSPMLPSYIHLFASLLFFSLLALRLLCFFLALGYFLVWSCCRYDVWQY